MAPRRPERLSRYAPVTEEGNEVRLVGGRCARCGKLVFPAPEFCPECAHGDIEAAELPQVGRLYTWSVVHAARPGWTAPYVIGYVDLAPDIRVLGHIVDVDPGELAIDMPVRLHGRNAVAKTGAEGVPAFAFVPAREGRDR
ncbi:MAG TPA: Zn-ribbon domain-containing OB-fold protein [Hyphomicrobiaceae bacterium]|nr:Zn-ribbon domain-containing OB-fold protein [Hyphomicrobiaceae bacterium]